MDSAFSARRTCSAFDCSCTSRRTSVCIGLSSLREDGVVYLGHWVSGELQIRPLFDENMHAVNALAFSPDGNYLAITNREVVTMIWETPSAMLFSHFSQSHAMSDVSFSPDGRQVI